MCLSHSVTKVEMGVLEGKGNEVVAHKKVLMLLTEKPAQKGQEWRTRAEVVSANAAKLTATMRQPSTICETPRESMIRERVRYSRRRDKLREMVAGLSEERPPGRALTIGIIIIGDPCRMQDKTRNNSQW
ncbi:hypothetical protein NDU88_006126 [Pleurodeles waltl]|uniref:Uncharacterized protein n=1 Tax=Pleurodeles waltl TaxID=8319 RepID=A0AAV7TXE9_PLEWA|nr:hypothetical protein NDU88_006126 [Pleurodeles waltl]